AEALAMVSATRPDVILLDLIMPVMDGAAFVAGYRRQGGQLAPIIVVSAGTEAKERAQELEAAGFLAKPFTLRALIQTVNDLTANPSRTLQLTH
ncbi:MAG: response regulator, partial [Chloroflexi bacterium]|nr:response regulator [Chloroflexota bacterium]